MLETLCDGKWHTLSELQEKSKTDNKQTKLLIEFLEKYDFISYNGKRNKIKLDKTVQKFLMLKRSR